MLFLLGAAFFAATGYIGILAASSIHISERFEDGPAPSEPPIVWLLLGCAAIGGLVATHVSAPSEVALAGLLCVVFTAVWCTDVRYGIVPDAFTLIPLAAIFVFAGFRHQWIVFASALIAFIPFAVAAALSGGRGMGWGDVKLAALGGAVLGAETATLAFAASCLVAVAIARLRGRGRAPVAFAPYLVTAIAVALPLGTQI